ncbi:VacJ family lipoprotein [Shimia sp.]|uniref:MlaA family lipoprotein n=1 Tax=Shimia sp. TaxID=1954381 RepID=UPI003567EF56
MPVAFVKRFKLGPVLPVLCAALLVAACAGDPAGPGAAGYNDPHEEANRRVHQFNKGIDRALIDPVAEGYGEATTGDMRQVVGNFASHLSLPNDVINNLLQGDVEAAVQNSGRFVVNTLIGFAGLLDPASQMNMPRERADFGQTLHVWGAAEGAYVELPFWGPSTTRDTVGIAVDLVLDPFVLLSQPESLIGTAAYVLDAMGNRYEYDATVESVLHDSADSYAQARSIYLQNRRFELGMGAEDAYLDPYLDAYSDPYEDF